MPLYLKDKKAILFKGEHKPVNLYLGDKKVTGYEYENASGNHVSFEGTYNDVANMIIYGKSEQIQTDQSTNLFNKSALVSNNITQIEEGFKVDSYYTSIPVRGVLDLKPNTTYFARRDYVGTGTRGDASSSIRLHNPTTGDVFQIIAADTDNSSVREIITPYDIQEYSLLRIYGQSDGEGEYSMVQVSLTNSPYEPFIPNSPSPDYPSPINSVEPFDFVSAGKNLFDGQFEAGYILPSTGADQDSTTYMRSINYIKLPKGYEYIGKRFDDAVGIRYYFYDLDGTYITSSGWATATEWFPNNVLSKIDRDVLCKIVLMNTVATNSYTFQLSFGSSISSYTPFRGSQSIHLPYTLRGLPDGTRDSVDLVSGLRTNNTGIITFTGNEAWWLPRGWYQTNTIMFNHATFAEVKYDLTKASGAISTHFNYNAFIDGTDVEGMRLSAAGQNFFVRIKKTIIGIDGMETTETQRTAKFKAWLAAQYAAGTPLKLMVCRQTPTTSQLTPKTIPTYYDYTQIYTAGSEILPLLQGKFRVMEG